MLKSGSHPAAFVLAIERVGEAAMSRRLFSETADLTR